MRGKPRGPGFTRAVEKWRAAARPRIVRRRICCLPIPSSTCSTNPLTEVVTYRGYSEDVRRSNMKLLMGSVIIAVALVAQLYPKKFPNRNFLIVCIGLYPFSAWFFLLIFERSRGSICFFFIYFLRNGWSLILASKYIILHGLLQFTLNTKEKNAILFIYSPASVCGKDDAFKTFFSKCRKTRSMYRSRTRAHMIDEVCTSSSTLSSSSMARRMLPTTSLKAIHKSTPVNV